MNKYIYVPTSLIGSLRVVLGKEPKTWRISDILSKVSKSDYTIIRNETLKLNDLYTFKTFGFEPFFEAIDTTNDVSSGTVFTRFDVSVEYAPVLIEDDNFIVIEKNAKADLIICNDDFSGSFIETLLYQLSTHKYTEDFLASPYVKKYASLRLQDDAMTL